MDYIGDLSLQDAAVLEEFARKSPNILEFGVGASTQIFSQCLPTHLTSVETDANWIKLVESKISSFSTKVIPKFLTYTTSFDCQYNLIFVDGVDNLRLDFAINTFKYLPVGGWMLFHDTRRLNDFGNALNLIGQYPLEVGTCHFNYKNSNITAIQKKHYEPYINWQTVEGKQPQQYSLELCH
jgi:hypothetical protein